MKSRHDVAMLVLAALFILSLISFFLSMISFFVMGAAEADYYYLPLQEFVSEDKQDAMIEKVFELSFGKKRIGSLLSIVFNLILLAGILFVRHLIVRMKIES